MKYALAGKRFGKWVVIKYLSNSKWECRCMGCGTVKGVLAHHLVHGGSNCCRKCSTKKHGMSASAEYRV
jgi:hypothetical protein